MVRLYISSLLLVIDLLCTYLELVLLVSSLNSSGVQRTNFFHFCNEYAKCVCMQHEWGRGGMHIGYWWEIQKEGDHWEDQDVDG
jgi:hypothetical protein